MKKVLLTFDLEEFDSPKDFNCPIEEKKMFDISKEGLDKLNSLLKKYNLSVTFFTTANFAMKYPSLLRELSKSHEIACHGFYHSDDYLKDISGIISAKKEIQKIIHKPIVGFRAPRFGIKDVSPLFNEGFKYDSSLHPTWIPGRYFNLFKKRKIHKIGKIFEIPPSVLPIIRLPIFWLAFKNLPLIYSKIFTKINFTCSEYTMLVFHPWEFADLTKIEIPEYVKKKNGDNLINLLEKYILFCKKNNYSFSSIQDFLLKSLK